MVKRSALDAFITSKLNDIPRKFGPLIAKLAVEAQGAEIIARLGTGEPSEELLSAIEAVIVWAGDSLLQGDELRRSLNAALENIVVEYIAPFGAQISEYISGVVESWSGDKISRTLESQVGADLQFIRVNGTLVGMLAGLMLFGLGEGLAQLASVR